MNIQSNCDYNYNISMKGFGKPPKGNSKTKIDKLKQSVLDKFKNRTFDDSNTSKTDKMSKLDDLISRPAQNRLIMGATALSTQPAIDYSNHKVDEETRTVARNRTIAKIIAGTTVGMLVRGSCYKLVKKMTNLNGVKKFEQALLPRGEIRKELEGHGGKYIKNYRSALATGLALLVMTFTNFLIDAPLTIWLTNRFNKKTQKLQKDKEVIYG